MPPPSRRPARPERRLAARGAATGAARWWTHLARDDRPLVFFLLGLAALVAAWFLGFALRAPLWDTDNLFIVRPIMVLLFDSGLAQGVNEQVAAGADPGQAIRQAVGSSNHVSTLVDLTFVVAIASGGYLACLWALRRGFRHSFAAAVAGTALGSLALLPMVPTISPDAVHLAADVRTLWLHGSYPTSLDATPADIDDPVAREVAAFKGLPSGYGPVAYAAGGLALPFTGDGLPANVAGQKAVAALFLVLTAFLAGLVARRVGMDAGFAAGAVGLNPLMLFAFAGEGHNDIMMAAFAMAALLFITGRKASEDLADGTNASAVEPGGLTLWRRRALGAVLAALSVLAKFALALAAPLVLAHWFPRLRLLFAAAAGIGLAAFAVALYNGDLPGIAALGPATAITRTSPWSIIIDPFSQTASGDDRRLMLAVAYAIAALVTVAIVASHSLRNLQDLIAATGILVFLFLFLCLPGYLPWYQAWYLPFAVLAGRRWLFATMLVFSIGAFVPILALQFASDIITHMDIDTPHHKAVIFQWAAVAITAVVVWRMDYTRQLREFGATMRRGRRPSRTRPARARR